MATTGLDHGLSPHPNMSSSIQSLGGSPSGRGTTSQVAKVYRHASSLFLTRRLPEALDSVMTVITPPAGFNAVNGDYQDATLVASASKNSRIKVWSLYLTLIDAIVNLPAEDGKTRFGNQQWREMVAKTRDGRIWEEVVKFGYGGHEGDVDPEVVINLATLLLAHAPSQTFNQQQIENYLSVSANPNLDFSNMVDSEGNMTVDSSRLYRVNQNGGTNTPRDLNSRIKILELYTLHVLPRNEEWDYAKEFIKLSEVLDEERRETFLQTLQALQDDKNKEAEVQREQEAQLQREKKEALARKAAEEARAAKQAQAEAAAQEPKKKNLNETDYGIDSAKPRSGSRHSKSRPATGPARTGRPAPRSKSIIKQASHIVAALQSFVTSATQSTLGNRTALIRFLLILLTLIVSLGQRNVRTKLSSALGSGWEKLKGTIGMGVKVSYI
jgi:hypothetical protein